MAGERRAGCGEGLPPARFPDVLFFALTAAERVAWATAPVPLRELIAGCFALAPEKRPTTQQLLEHPLLVVERAVMEAVLPLLEEIRLLEMPPPQQPGPGPSPPQPELSPAPLPCPNSPPGPTLPQPGPSSRASAAAGEALSACWALRRPVAPPRTRLRRRKRRVG